MDTVDITPTPEACRQIARLFRQQKDLAARAAQALTDLDGCDAADLAPWGRAFLTAAFEALYEDEGARIRHMDEALDALGPYVHAGDSEEDHEDAH